MGSKTHSRASKDLKSKIKQISEDEYGSKETIEFSDIKKTSMRLEEIIIRTPCIKSHMSGRLNMDVYLKQETFHRTGSVCERGAINALMVEECSKAGVITASNGNFGIALAAVAGKRESQTLPCTIVMPTTSPTLKIALAKKTGATVIVEGENLEEAKKRALEISEYESKTYIDGDRRSVIEAYGTIGIEIVEQVPSVAAIIVPVGCGGLLAGIAIAIKHLKPDIQIYACETEKTCSVTESLKKKERTFVNTDSTTVADGLATNIVGENAFSHIKGLIQKMVVLKEDWVARAVMRLMEEDKIVVEGAGAVAFGTVLAGMLPQFTGKKVVCIVSGSNVDSTVLGRILEWGMALEGRLVKFKVNIPDKPGTMGELCSALAEMGITIHSCTPNRVWCKGEVYETEFKLVVETKGLDHAKKLTEVMHKKYSCQFVDTSERPVVPPEPPRVPCLAPNPVCMQK